jgi:hypothetical protein
MLTKEATGSKVVGVGGNEERTEMGGIHDQG